MAAPSNYYGDPSLVLEHKHEQEKTCRVCIYNLRRSEDCLLNRREHPNDGKDCPKFKHKDTGAKYG